MESCLVESGQSLPGSALSPESLPATDFLTVSGGDAQPLVITENPIIVNSEFQNFSFENFLEIFIVAFFCGLSLIVIPRLFLGTIKSIWKYFGKGDI